MTYLRQTSTLAASLLLFLAAGGCGAGDSSVHLTGHVTYDGQPVPRGTITFSPDGKQGNTGHGSKAIITDGAYTTQESFGLVGGPHVVRIEGFDGVANGDNLDGKLLFPPHEESYDLPMESGEYDFDIPKSTKKPR
ncbi:hypothetical protein C5Y96_01970 [Blastopirellula marina]|uniref:Carboxypeptidase regulatory-like domain-containing protein n=1 Tax=Blastopirellula marina TaxID=124 RepID=A0A2S8G3E8_9BACT|nr:MULTISPECIES: hypothetical protein [Pirellulaceae]PQO38674.1 hypothetical protein C5Y96_01970 [Blastopirellula marina]RCS54982.1 hypothetical protein DTL36_01975 [Bremerella cremea]